MHLVPLKGKKGDHFKEELPSFKQILSDLGLETWAPCEVHKSSPSYEDIEYSACKLRKIPSWNGVDLSFLHEDEVDCFPNLGGKHEQRHKSVLRILYVGLSFSWVLTLSVPPNPRQYDKHCLWFWSFSSDLKHLNLDHIHKISSERYNVNCILSFIKRLLSNWYSVPAVH